MQPAGFEKIVRTSLKSPPEDSEFNLFTPGDLEEDVLMPESLVKPPHGLSLDMVVANCNPFPVHLKKGTVLGRVEPAVLANEEEIVGDTGAEGSPEQPPEEETHVAALSEQGTQNRQRLRELVGLLPLKLDHLSEEEHQKLMKCLEANTDMFALNTTELGTTSLVSHAIDTGESKPI